jgi:hypothetical protein
MDDGGMHLTLLHGRKHLTARCKFKEVESGGLHLVHRQFGRESGDHRSNATHFASLYRGSATYQGSNLREGLNYAAFWANWVEILNLGF